MPLTKFYIKSGHFETLDGLLNNWATVCDQLGVLEGQWI